MTVITNDKLTGLLNDINTIDDVVESTSNTTTSKLGTTVRTLKGFNADGDSAISTFNSSANSALDQFELDADIAIANAGYQIVGDFSDVTKAEITSENQVYTSKFVTDLEQFVWRYTGSLPYTPTESTPVGGEWKAVAIGELRTIARSLNVGDTAVIYSTDTTTVLDNVLYIYDAPTQTTWGVPALDSVGKTILSVSGSTLTTTGGAGSNSYALITQSKSDLKMTLSEAVASTDIKLGDSIRVTDRGDGVFDVVSGSGVTANTFDIVSCTGNASLALYLRTDSYSNILHFGAKMNMTDDDAPAILAMTNRLGVMVAPSSGNYEHNDELGGSPTIGVLISSDVECRRYQSFDFGNNQVKISNGASFIPEQSVYFTRKVTWKNLNIVDSAGQVFISCTGQHDFQSCKIENIDISELETLIYCEDTPSWWSSNITSLKAVSLTSLFSLSSLTGQTGNTCNDMLIQNTGQLFLLDNATAQCSFDGLNYGIDSNTVGCIVSYTGTTNTATDKLSFTNYSFEYDDNTALTPFLQTDSAANMEFFFSDGGIYHDNLVAMNASGYYPINITGNGNKISMKNTSNWRGRYPDSQGVYLNIQSGDLYNCDLRPSEIEIGANGGRIYNIERAFTMADSGNVAFSNGSYSFSNKMLHVSFFGITQAALVSGDVIFDFPELNSFLNNTIDTSDYRIVANAATGNIQAGESVELGAGVSFSGIIPI